MQKNYVKFKIQFYYKPREISLAVPWQYRRRNLGWSGWEENEGREAQTMPFW
jgi:hypothetical protein